MSDRPTPADIYRRLGGEGDPPPSLGSCYGRVVILGGAACVWDDLMIAPAHAAHIAVNDVGQFWHGAVDHWVTQHPEYMPGWRAYRRGHCYPGNTLVHGVQPRHGVDVAWLIASPFDSGLLAALIALMLGYDDITLCGLPADTTPHFFDPPWQRSDLDTAQARCAWHEAGRDYFHGRVRSMSGNTRTWLEG